MIGSFRIDSHCFVLLLIIGICIFSNTRFLSAHAESLKAQIEHVANPYQVAAGDVLSIKVFPQQEYSEGEIIVRSDGMATFPGAGDVNVAGKTVESIAAEVTKQLSTWLNNAQITVAVLRPRPITVYLSGAVIHAGSIQIISSPQDSSYHSNTERPISRIDQILTNILSSAGGVSMNADISRIEIHDPKTNIIQTVNLWLLLKEGDISQDLWINPGSSIRVPYLENPLAVPDEDFQLLLSSSVGPKGFPVRVLGAVTEPSIIEMDARSPLLNSAISKAGGYSSSATRNVVAIRRFTSETNFNTLFVNPNKMDIVLHPNDVVYVSENSVYKSGRFMQQVSNILSPFATAASALGMGAQGFGYGGWYRNSRRYVDGHL